MGWVTFLIAHANEGVPSLARAYEDFYTSLCCFIYICTLLKGAIKVFFQAEKVDVDIHVAELKKTLEKKEKEGAICSIIRERSSFSAGRQ